MQFMVIERFKDPKKVYERFAFKGRMAPPEVRVVDSWVDVTGERCFQLMECAELAPLMQWIAAWQDLASFEVVPIVPSRVAAGILGPNPATADKS